MADVRCFTDCETVSKRPLVIFHTTLREADSRFSLVNEGADGFNVLSVGLRA